MKNYKKLLIALVVLIGALFLRDAPYLNVPFTDKIWIAYGLLLLYLFPIFKSKHTFPLIIVFLTLAIVFTFINFSAFAEIAGVFVFILLCVMFAINFKDFLKDR